jgi:ubiquinone biosynthesis protein
MWATAEPVVGGWIAENLGPRGKIEDFGRGLALLADIIADAPQRLERVGRLIERWEDASAIGDLFGGLERIALHDGRRIAFAPMAALFAIVALLAVIAWRM